jgi:hypothetical protein
MPLQNPTSSIISRSYFVRASRRCASSSLPSLRSSITRASSSSRMPDRPPPELVLGHHVVHRGEQEELRLLGEQLAGRRVDQLHPLDLVAEQLDPHRELLVGGPDLDRVTPRPVLPA